MLQKILLLIINIGLVSCATQKPHPLFFAVWPETFAKPSQSLENSTIVLEETACFGECPIYKMVITIDDKYTVFPEAFTRYKTEKMGVLPSGTYNKIIEIAENTNFLNNSFYFSRVNSRQSELRCPSFWTDSPSSIFYIKNKGKQTDLQIYWGCTDITNYNDIETFFSRVRDILDVENLVYPVK